MKTAIAEQFEAKGITARVVAFRMALAQFRNNGGTYDEALAELNAAYADGQKIYSSAGRLLSERAAALKMGSAVSVTVPKGHKANAAAPQPNAAKGQEVDADKANGAVPDAATERSAGQTLSADKAEDLMPSASPRKMPGHARRGAAAIASVQQTMAKSLFDTIRLPGDDRAIGDITWKELQGLARKHAEAYRLLSLIDGYGQPADPDVMVREVLKEDTLREFVEIARLANVH